MLSFGGKIFLFIYYYYFLCCTMVKWFCLEKRLRSVWLWFVTFSVFQNGWPFRCLTWRKRHSGDLIFDIGNVSLFCKIMLYLEQYINSIICGLRHGYHQLCWRPLKFLSRLSEHRQQDHYWKIYIFCKCQKLCQWAADILASYNVTCRIAQCQIQPVIPGSSSETSTYL